MQRFIKNVLENHYSCNSLMIKRIKYNTIVDFISTHELKENGMIDN